MLEEHKTKAKDIINLALEYGAEQVSVSLAKSTSVPLSKRILFNRSSVQIMSSVLLLMLDVAVFRIHVVRLRNIIRVRARVKSYCKEGMSE